MCLLCFDEMYTKQNVYTVFISTQYFCYWYTDTNFGEFFIVFSPFNVFITICISDWKGFSNTCWRRFQGERNDGRKYCKCLFLKYIYVKIQLLLFFFRNCHSVLGIYIYKIEVTREYIEMYKYCAAVF